MRSIDAFARPMEGLITPSSSGGFCSLLALFLCSLLLLSEIIQFAHVDENDHLSVVNSAANEGKSVNVRVLITFPHLLCSEIALDASNTKADTEEDKKTGLAKKKGKRNKKNFSKRADVSKRKMTKWERGLMVANNYGYQPSAEDSIRRGDLESSKSQDVGCTLDGVIQAGMVGGNFKVELTENVWGNVAMLGAEAVGNKLNVSHYIHEITFGKHFPLADNPLAGVVNGIPDGIGGVQFGLKVIATKYARPFRRTREYFQVSMTSHFLKLSTLLMNGNMQNPGITFNYDYGAMEVNHVESREGFVYFIASLCAVVGGVFTTVGLVYGTAKSVVGVKKVD
jgi:hypothetical protein